MLVRHSDASGVATKDRVGGRLVGLVFAVEDDEGREVASGDSGGGDSIGKFDKPRNSHALWRTREVHVVEPGTSHHLGGGLER